MPRPLPGGGRRLLLQGRQRRQVSARPLTSLHDQQWNQVIQFSARHLFCPAHATTTKATSAIVIKARMPGTIVSDIPHIVREHRSGIAVHSFLARSLSTAAALASDPPTASSPYSRERERHQQQRREANNRQGEHMVYGGSISEKSMAGSDVDQTDRSPTEPGIESSSSPSSSSSQSPPPTPTNRSKPQHSKSIDSWRFPTITLTNRNHRHNYDRPTDPVQSWTSAARTLSRFYKALHQIKFKPAQHSPSSALQSALSHYNSLSRLQSTHDTVLISRRDTRTLFLLQGREPKTGANLEQLLRIAVDLIWLNEKERQRKRGASTGSGLKPVPDAAASSTSNRSDSDIHYTPEAKATATPLPRVHSCADDYHGLRVSEYTILMNWISYGTEALEPTSYNCSRLSLSSSSSLSPSTFLPLKHQGSPIDKAWATWQDFLLTGMKPDVVLYTAMLNTLLRTKEFDRAGQLWSHMHHQDGHEHRHLHHQGEPSDLSSDSKVDTIEDPGLVSKPLDLETISVSPSSSRNVNTPSLRTELQNPGSSHLPDMDPRSRHQHYLRSSSKGSWSRASVTPNVQTFSVLMQTHVLNRDLQGVSQTYKALLQQQQAFSQSGSHSRHQQYQRRANATVMNQVLRVLVDMGESKAAKEVYAEMRTDGPESSGGSSEGYTLPAREMLAQEGTPEPGMSSPSPFNHAAALSSSPVFTKPLHHQLFLRRSDWRRKVRKIASTPSVNHGDATAAGALTMRPDKTTHRLMLELARREADHELEELVIKDTSTKK